jgi:hypothetical protein
MAKFSRLSWILCTILLMIAFMSLISKVENNQLNNNYHILSNLNDHVLAYDNQNQQDYAYEEQIRQVNDYNDVNTGMRLRKESKDASSIERNRSNRKMSSMLKSLAARKDLWDILYGKKKK